MVEKSGMVSPIASLLIVLLLVMTASSVPQEKKDDPPAPRAYVEQTLEVMQKSALNRNSIKWTQVRQETLTRAKDAKTTFDTYPAIAYALTQLGENHSFLQLPDDMSAEQKAAIQAKMIKVKPQLLPAKDSPYSPSKEIQGHIDRNKGRAFAHVIVPMCLPRYADWEKNGADFQQFADQLHAILIDLQAKKPDGWIIDLRGNQGGNMWPMLAGVGAVLGEGDLGAFEFPDGNRVPWFYKAGKVGTRAEQGVNISSEIKLPPFVFDGQPWVAVLVDRATGSSGEVVAISFAGRARARSFGEHTAGFTTANTPHPLPDGAVLVLCEGLEADRTGKLYRDGIEPDVIVPAPEARPAEEKDSTVQAAKEWLARQTEQQH